MWPEFLTGKYAAYIVPAYGGTVFALGAMILSSWRSYRQVRRKLAEFEKKRGPVKSRIGTAEG